MWTSSNWLLSHQIVCQRFAHQILSFILKAAESSHSMLDYWSTVVQNCTRDIRSNSFIFAWLSKALKALLQGCWCGREIQSSGAQCRTIGYQFDTGRIYFGKFSNIDWAGIKSRFRPPLFLVEIMCACGMKMNWVELFNSIHFHSICTRDFRTKCTKILRGIFFYLVTRMGL